MSHLKPKPPYNGYLNIEGWLTPGEAKGLYNIAQSLRRQSVVVEIGSWKGKSTFCIAKGLKHGTIYCIDPFNADGETGSKELYETLKGKTNLLEQFHSNLSGLGSAITVKPLVGYSRAFTGSIRSIDFLFIDGDHSIEGCRHDFDNFSQYINIGGYIAFHDYDPTREDLGPTWVIEHLVKTESSYAFVKTFDTLAVFRKIKR